MSRILMMQVLFLFSGFVYAQSDMFSLSLRLVKPDGFVNEKAYFEVALVNKTSDTTFLVSSISDASRGMGANKRSFLIPEVVLKSGETVRNIEQVFFILMMIVILNYCQEKLMCCVLPSVLQKLAIPACFRFRSLM